MTDYYKLLGVPNTATPREITKAFRKLAKTCHPDSNPNNPAAEKKFKEISKAYEVLSNDTKRAEYDQQNNKPKQPQRQQPRQQKTTTPKNMADFFKQNAKSDMFEQYFGFSEAPKDTEKAVKMTDLKKALFGKR